MEELARVGATTFVRIGTCGTFQDRVHNGDIAIFDSAARYDGASRLYAPLEFPAVASHEIVEASIAAGRGARVPVPRRHDPDGRQLLRAASAAGLVVRRLLAVVVARALRGPQAHERDRRRDGGERDLRAGPGLGPARRRGRGRAGQRAEGLGRVGRVRPAGPVRARRRRDRASRPYGLGDRPDRGGARRRARHPPREPAVPRQARAGRRRPVRAAARRPGTGSGRRFVLGRGPRGQPQPRVRDLHRDLSGCADLVHLDRDRGAVDRDRARGARAGGRDDLRADRDMRFAPGARQGGRPRDLRLGGAVRRRVPPVRAARVPGRGRSRRGDRGDRGGRRPGRDAPRRDDVLDRRLLHAAGGRRVRRLPPVLGARDLRGRAAPERPRRRDGVQRRDGPRADLGAARRRDGGRVRRRVRDGGRGGRVRRRGHVRRRRGADGASRARRQRDRQDPRRTRRGGRERPEPRPGTASRAARAPSAPGSPR